MNDAVIFYRSFYEAVKDLPPSDYKEAVNAMLGYGMDGTEPDAFESKVAQIVYTMAKPQIEANNKRKQNGAKGAEYGKLGGRPRKKPIGVNDENPIGVNSETPKDKVKVKDKVKDKEKSKEKDKEKVKEIKHTYGEYAHVRITDTELEKLKKDFGEDMTQQAITYLDEYIEMKGYKAQNHYLAIRKWVIDAVKEHTGKERQPRQSRAAAELDDFYNMAAEWAKEG